MNSVNSMHSVNSVNSTDDVVAPWKPRRAHVLTHSRSALVRQNIWIGGVGIGGCNDGPGIMTLKKNGELFGMLEKAGAVKASDPMEAYCAEDPSADECRVYED